ncbi:His-Xaa-Ser system protein HxsD [Candidatus Falkowbacteria bacterium RIFOXYB2_FULL_34_18]|uniref:His-Xaa-Ser system protein HxsD n=1 Tax=Candidatus Falkowbacteria bacterium RIFOXYD2_FULL_34_120 TaxID=1798007 RepID=A0A1F5TQM8_9BACT|nr:MAG: His-Xaa-Ser system protein HxsD [Candidatus Falkowbacteria bacterium RIFOXYB2_FULL_34_18]OGF29404.1 MAG: His-Xaa-Ser system protein HxsD [Candidatus Falkowbacteria bacterium RIFOXYC12_FULL_34_55]OGF36613.1 MAG: His-Xaa-Ser system protein HxsD [Candidatus Falkowbacteria bacterium RIFOXYC2_FULL_34_220]OGF38831.1 MAG: His-Xaa-Ser system protein HxsD [Candidatus Falkowbacteria bacterium RIFOXYD12_FULL_34_57]OGF41064.1 MAG: His-Xaa-Ser system protein HxsD [Candidatus Falkowbacteria bacterium
MENKIKIKLDIGIYPLEAVYAACYMFIDRVYIYLEDINEKKQIFLQFKAKEEKLDMEVIKGEFLNELLHCVYRINIAKNNKKIREYIVEKALFSAISQSDNEDDLIFDDPLGIAIPWEEKYGDGKK